MNAVKQAFQNALQTPDKDFHVRYGEYKFTFRGKEAYANKLDGRDSFDNHEVDAVSAEMKALTGRGWCRLQRYKDDHDAHFHLVPEVKPREGTHIAPGEFLFPAPDGVSVTTLNCHFKDYEECAVELMMTGRHFTTPVKYGFCPDCERCFVSAQKGEAVSPQPTVP